MRVLIAEDDADIARQVAEALRSAGFVVDVVGDGVDAWHAGAHEPYDATVLDIGLPGLDGLTVLRRWRDAGVALPVLLLTARGSWTDKVHGIDAGADDYLAKPFHMPELVSRVRALVRRAHGVASPVLQHGRLRFDPRAQSATLDGVPLALTAAELRLLGYLLHHPGETLSRTQLVEHLYEQDRDRDSNTIEVFVARLRRKLGADIIETVRGVGYRLGPAAR